jgi:hypothetical protein
VQGNIAEFFHAASQQGIARGAEYGDSRQDEVFSKGHLFSILTYDCVQSNLNKYISLQIPVWWQNPELVSYRCPEGV